MTATVQPTRPNGLSPISRRAVAAVLAAAAVCAAGGIFAAAAFVLAGCVGSPSPDRAQAATGGAAPEAAPGAAARPPGSPVDGPLLPEERANHHPIVLVHGAFGFGRDELWGYRYWGGPVDLQEGLRRRGYRILTAAVGPVSSNWDRACELYAFLKGGRVDYGQAHSQRFGHERYGRSYPGLLPEWGDPDPLAGRARKVHLVGHSLGGQTARVLVQLLAEGCAEERGAAMAQPAAAHAAAGPGYGAGNAGDDAARGGPTLSPLFAGGHDWVASVSTLCTPHDGTTAIVRFRQEGSGMKPLLRLLVSLTGTSEQAVFDFKLDQWGLERRPGVSMREYRTLVAESPVWRNLEDTGLWDGSPEGARELNRWVRAREGVFYFSWGADKSFRDPLTGRRVPAWGMNPNLVSLSHFLGSYTRNEPGGVAIDRTWWPNDGLVNTRSMAGPTLGSSDRIVSHSDAEPGELMPGVWNFMGVLESVDHVDIIGVDPLRRSRPEGSRSLLEWYASLAELLASLPE